MYLPMLSDEELCNYADQTTDSLVTSDLERELIKRLERRLAEDEVLTPLRNTLTDNGVDFGALPKLVELLVQYNVLEVDALDQKLERADKFHDIASEAGDVIERLAGLVKETA